MFVHQIESDLTKLPIVKRLPGNVFTNDSQANEIRVVVTDNGKAVALSGYVKAFIKKPDGSTMDVLGSKSGNVASVILPSGAYDTEGMLGIYLRIEYGGQKTTIGGVEGYCYKSRTSDLIYDPVH